MERHRSCKNKYLNNRKEKKDQYQRVNKPLLAICSKLDFAKKDPYYKEIFQLFITNPQYSVLELNWLLDGIVVFQIQPKQAYEVKLEA